jgi:hypothetical protein
MTAWDGQWYARIATDGYFYSNTEQSSIAFFPAYPLLARILMTLGLSASSALLLLSNGFFLCSLLLLPLYLEARRVNITNSRIKCYTVLTIALWPTAFFFHVGYSESMLLFLSLLVLYGIARHWSFVTIAIIVGGATATRAVGVALLLPFSMYIWSGSSVQACEGNTGAGGYESAAGISGKRNEAQRFTGRLARSIIALPIAIWGLLGFLIFQQCRFHDPFAFSKAQLTWHSRSDLPTVGGSIMALASLEPVRAVYSSQSPCSWRVHAPHDEALLNMDFANPILFLGTAALLCLGAMKGWLARNEWTWGALVLAIPYAMQSYRMCMMSHGRFALVVFPAYIVVGHLLGRLPTLVVCYIVTCSGLLMTAYTVLFTSWYPLF